MVLPCIGYLGQAMVFMFSSPCLVQDRHPSAISSGIDGLSKFASSLIPLARDIVGEFSGRDYYAVGLTEEVVTFANSIAVHPETWLSFPLPEEEDDEGMSGPI